MRAQVLTLACLMWTCAFAAVEDDCRKEFDEYLGTVALEAYASGDLETLQQADTELKRAKEMKAAGDSCGALAYIKRTPVAERLTQSRNTTAEGSMPLPGDAEDNNSEIDWTNVPGDVALIDLSMVDAYIATVKSCNKRYPDEKSQREALAHGFLGRIGYSSMKNRARDHMAAKGKASTFRAMQLMAPLGEDTRAWSQSQCDAYTSETPFDRMYTNRK